MPPQPPPRRTIALALGAIAAAVLALVIVTQSYQSVPPGHAAVADLFGKVQPEPYGEGFHFPVNPLYSWHLYDVRQKTHMEHAEVPSQDQLQTQIDVSVQYRLVEGMVPRILSETGDAEDAVDVHLVPKLRSLVREQGKSVARAEDFFQETTQEHLQDAVFTGLSEYLAPKGIEVQAVLLRDIQLPEFIVKAIESKKEREQAVERQRAELERFRLEQEQSVARAQAERKAAEEEAGRRRLLADAQAYEIERINSAIGSNPTYVQLMALDALKAISKDPAAKMYFIDGKSGTPLPLMHMGER